MKQKAEEVSEERFDEYIEFHNLTYQKLEISCTGLHCYQYGNNDNQEFAFRVSQKEDGEEFFVRFYIG